MRNSNALGMAMNGTEFARCTIPGVVHRYFVVDGTVWMVNASGRTLNKGRYAEFCQRIRAGKVRAELIGGAQ